MVEVADRFGPYTCLRRLGAGGMAETFLAVQRGVAGFEQRVCVKFILPTHRDDQAFKSLFLREASIAASLRHSNIVGVIDVDQESGYIVLELVDGVDLRALLTATPGHRLAPHLVALIALELAKALAYAHSRTVHGQPAGVVHRDLSPSNVLVSYAGEVKLTDFGIAKAMHSEAEPPSQTIKGKLCYMSPEQTRSEALDGRSDLFALGVVCYELLTGQRPFDGQTDAETILRLNRGEHVPLSEAAPDVPGGLGVVIERALCVDRAARYPDADAFIDALSRFTPPATAYRELGEAARRARPHETLSTSELEQTASEALTPKTARGVLRSRRASEPPPSPFAPTQTRTPTTRQMGAAEPGEPAPRVSARAWLALGASLLVLAAVSVAWTTRLPAAAPIAAPVQASSNVALQPKTAAQDTPAVQPSSANDTTSPVVAAALGPVVNAGLPADAGTHGQAAGQGASAPSEAQPSAAVPGGRLAQLETSVADEPAQRVGDREAVLRVGTIPFGQVWIDGKAAGWSPVLLHVAPGRHTIAGGNDAPRIRKELRLRPGERRQLVLNLEDAPAATAGATGR